MTSFHSKSSQTRRTTHILEKCVLLAGISFCSPPDFTRPWRRKLRLTLSVSPISTTKPLTLKTAQWQDKIILFKVVGKIAV